MRKQEAILITKAIQEEQKGDERLQKQVKRLQKYIEEQKPREMGKVDANKLDAIIKEAKALKKAEKQMGKYRSKSVDPELSRKSQGNNRSKVEHEAQFIEDRLHELHCLCVELGVADLDEERYGEFTLSPNEFHTNRVIRRRPNV